MIPAKFILPVYTGLLGFMVLALVPRGEIRRLVPYAMVLGAVIDSFNILFFTKLLNVGGYRNFEPFGFLGFPMFSALAATTYIILYLYFMPERKPWIYISPVLGAVLSTIFSNVQMKLGSFYWNYGTVLIPTIIFLITHIEITWGYLWLTRPEKPEKELELSFFRIKQPVLLKKRFIKPRKIK